MLILIKVELMMMMGVAAGVRKRKMIFNRLPVLEYDLSCGSTGRAQAVEADDHDHRASAAGVTTTTLCGTLSLARRNVDRYAYPWICVCVRQGSVRASAQIFENEAR